MHFTNDRFTAVLTQIKAGGWYQLTVLHLIKNKHDDNPTSNSIGHIYFNSDGRLFFAYFTEYADIVNEALDFLKEELSSNGITSFATCVTVASNEVEKSIKTNGIVKYLEMQIYE